MERWGNVSLWMEQVSPNISARPSLQTNISADIAIIGGGFTGLWSAYYLKKQAPEKRIVLLEAETVGFGASGRNGGWLMGELANQDTLLAGLSDQDKHQAHALIHGIPDEVANVLASEKIDCDYKKGGVLYVAARYPEQLPRLKALHQHFQQEGYLDTDFQWLEKAQLDQQLNIESSQGALYSPHCARIQPAKLARGLADVLEAMGVEIYEQSKVLKWQPGLVTTKQGSVQCEWVIPAVEAYGHELKNAIIPLKRYHLPVQSLIIATEPLSQEIWDSIGLEQGQVFSDFSRQVTYGQRTADNRMVFGARGGYQFNGKLRTCFDLTDEEVNLRRDIMIELFPQLSKSKITHAWGGNLAMSRKFHPHVIKDLTHKFVTAGGYGGEGVGATNLAGRTIADLVLGKQSNHTRMPWVVASNTLKELRMWEREPIPYLGYKAVIQSFDREDKVLSNPNSKKAKRYLVSKFADFMESFLS